MNSIKNSINSLIPKLGCLGPFRMEMFRGVDGDIRQDKSFKFATDPRDYGRGEYWASYKSFAESYGPVITRVIKLNNALHLSSNEIVTLAKDTYGTTISKGKGHCRLEAAQRLTQDMLNQSYDGVVV